MEPGHPGPHAVGKLSDECVVVLQGVVVALALDGNAIFRAGQFILQAQKILIREKGPA